MSTLVVAGMHRSGTSYTASVLESAGVFMGPVYHPADAFNARGYFEDVAFLDLQRRMVASACPTGQHGFPDWGWCELDTPEVNAYESFAPQADAIITQRSAAHSLWGWKDPRTTLLLDFWVTRLPHAKFVFVYRAPWDVADSIQRLNAKVFRENPDWPLKIWDFYNRKLLDFVARNRERCVIAPLERVRQNAHAFVCQVAEKLTLPLVLDQTRCNSLFDAGILRHSHPSSTEAFAARHPGIFATWRSLEASADDSPSPRKHVLPRPPQSSGRPKLAIVIPCFNQGEYLADALQSVASAGGQSHETIIVNDGSTEPATLTALGAAEAQGWRVVHQVNKGLSEARNRGIAETSADYLLPLDVDNCIAPDFISDAVAVLDASPQVGVVYGDPEFFGMQNGRREVGGFDLNRLAISNYIDACAIFRRQVWQTVGGFDREIKTGHEDWDFWLGAAMQNVGFHYLAKICFRYRVREGSLLSEGQKPENFARDTAHISRKHSYYRDHYPEVIGALNGNYVSELSARRRRDAQLSAAHQAQQKLEARLSELERHADALTSSRAEAVRYAESLRDALDALHIRYMEATAYAESLEREIAKSR